MKTFVKICGITNPEDAKIAAGSGADFLGVILEINGSPRSVSVDTARKIIDVSSIPVILLLEKPCRAIKQLLSHISPHGVQLIGEYPLNDIKGLKAQASCAVWKTIRVPKNKENKIPLPDLLGALKKYPDSGVDVLVLDTLVKKKKGGTGQICDWSTAEKLVSSSPVPVFLAGGITPVNVKKALDQVQPYGIDVSSGVEIKPGRKDPQKIKQLMQNIK